MSSTLNPNQVYLITYRGDVVVFCTRVFQKFATVQRITAISEVPLNCSCIVIFDAIDNAVTFDFLQQIKKYNVTLVSIISPCISAFIQIKLKDVSSFWVYSGFSGCKMDGLERYLLEKIEGEKQAIRLGSPISGENKPIEGLFAGVSAGIQKFRESLVKAAMIDTPVLLLGETGCGKTSAAKLIHNLSRRRDGPFIPVSPADIVPSLCESAFFGKTIGAYTDAKADKGFFLRSNHGVLFFDEIGTLRVVLQEKLLTFVENYLITPVGSTKQEKIDTRIILATNADIKAMYIKGSFRRDLYHRIDNNILTIPSLRQRPEDIPYVAKQYLKENKVEKFLSKLAIEKMLNYSWPGNIRELNHCMERAVRNSHTEKIYPESIDFGLFD